ncbi:MAG TPA: hypothetical protein VGN18_15410 [Jatrophihabitans sp.]|jgi:hypothetical protein|uniref:hypothetical protein n=1 Tax=Jatrophihabitans sp. TaxID=1932789 RepID=UPI002DFE6586|nr:hypothetical protein [Jatrophihabitans sp.]
MCSPARCRSCGKTTWRGCGRHVDAVMAHVPSDQRCTCAPAEKSGSFLTRLRRR